MSRSKDIKIKTGNRSYDDSSIAADQKRINKTENLANELGIFRLASVHRDLDLANQPPPNAVLVNLRIKFITKSGIEVGYAIPIMVTLGENEEVVTCYNGSEIDEEKFFEFYQSVKPEVKVLNRQNHYHSEPFLAYYLCSEDGKNFLVREFERKGLIKVSEDGETFESNVREVTEVGLDLHSTKVVCFNCGPFLKAAIPNLLESINLALVLPKGKTLKGITFNVSANDNFNRKNISYINVQDSNGRWQIKIVDNFDHIPVLESEDKNILTNTEKLLGASKVKLQKVGEASNRTYFLSGSKPLNDEVIALRDLDEKRWQIVSNAAAVEIQRMWRGFSVRKKFKQEQTELRKNELRAVNAEIDEKENKIEELKKEINDFQEKLELVSEINDLVQRIEDDEIDGQDEVYEIEDLYERAIEDGLFEETENSFYDPDSKFDFLLEIQDSEENLKKQKIFTESSLSDLEEELGELSEQQKTLEQKIKDLTSLAPNTKSSSRVTKESSQKSLTNLEQDDDLNIFNYVGTSSNLTHQNVLYLISQAFELSGLDENQASVAVISEDKSLDDSLRNEILRFIGQEPTQDRMSIALCRGYIDEESGQISGNTHWTALHLRRIENEDGSVLIRAYHMDSMGNSIPFAVERVLESIRKTKLEDLGDDLASSDVYQRAIERLEHTDFKECLPLIKNSTKQTDSHSCGYHSVFNMLRMHNGIRENGKFRCQQHVIQGGDEVTIDQFIEDKKADLQSRFNPQVDAGLRLHLRFSADIDLNRALSESILISDETNLNKLKKLVQLEKEIKKLDPDPTITLSSLNLEKFYKKLLSQCVEEIRYKFLTAENRDIGEVVDVLKREQILEKLSSARTSQNPQDFLEIVERIDKNPNLLSSGLDSLMEDIADIEKDLDAEESLTNIMAKSSLEDKAPSSSPTKVEKIAKKLKIPNAKITQKATGK
jgi:hypothetical protein